MLLQQTRSDQDGAATIATKYCTAWGFNSTIMATTLSQWSPTKGRRGGVTLLLSPFSTVTALTPVQQSLRNEHWMVVTVGIRGKTVLVLNVYAPQKVTQQEQLFDFLLKLRLSHDGLVLYGCDFNCTLDPERDRTYQ